MNDENDELETPITPAGRPCDACPTHDRCAAQRLACYDFAIWVRDGVAPLDTQPRIPTSQILDLVDTTGAFEYLREDPTVWTAALRRAAKWLSPKPKCRPRVGRRPAGSAKFSDAQIIAVYNARGSERLALADSIGMSRHMARKIGRGERHRRITGAGQTQ
ncbi:MAG TPA: hypothetical protein VFM56_07245 [Solimonas sp.]|nr:hypothetical protein [Solimonas sp.]